jgi:ribosomal protein S11
MDLFGNLYPYTYHKRFLLTYNKTLIPQNFVYAVPNYLEEKKHLILEDSTEFFSKGGTFYPRRSPKKNHFDYLEFQHTFFNFERNKELSQNILFIRFTQNNLIVSLADSSNGNILINMTSGLLKKKGAFHKKKNFRTYYSIIQKLNKKFKLLNRSYFIKVKVMSKLNLRQLNTIIQALENCGFKITVIHICIPIAHNGCKIKKSRRL